MIYTYLEDYSEEELLSYIWDFSRNPDFQPEQYPDIFNGSHRDCILKGYVQHYLTAAHTFDSQTSPIRENLIHWLSSQNITPSTFIDKATPVFFEDSFIASAIRNNSQSRIRHGWKRHHDSFTCLSLSKWANRVTILENFVRIASFDSKTLSLGYAKLKNLEDMLFYDSPTNQPFNIGVGLMIVQAILKSEEVETNLADQLYAKNIRTLTERIQHELDVDTSILFKGYFEVGDCREAVQKAFLSRFNAPMQVLGDIYGLPLEMRWAVDDILKNNFIVLSHSLQNKDLAATYQGIALHFKNVRVESTD